MTDHHEQGDFNSDIDKLINKLKIYYSQLFTLGTLRKNILRYIFSYIFIIIVCELILWCIISRKYNIGNTSRLVIYYTFISILYPIISFILDNIVIKLTCELRDRKLFNIRRLLALNTIANLIIIVILLLSIPLLIAPYKGGLCKLHMFYRYAYSLDLASSVSQGFKLFILAAMLKTGIASYFIVSITGVLFFIYALIWPIQTSLLIKTNTVTIFFTPIITMSVLSLLALYNINRIFYNELSEKTLSFLKGYVDCWILDNPSTLNHLFDSHAFSVKLPINLVLIPNTKYYPILIIAPYFHFGPFKNVGSSRFPGDAAKFFYKRFNINAITVHTPSTHDLDLSSNNEVLNVLTQIADFKKPIISTSISDIHPINDKDITVYYVRIDNSIIIMIEGVEMEDIPWYVAKEIREYGKKLGYNIVCVIDMHNSLTSEELKISEEKIKKIIELSKKALNEGRRCTLYPVKIGCIKIDPPSSKSIGIGSNGISIIMWETFKSLNAMIVLDSNNMHPHLKKEIISVMHNLGVNNIVVLTTDTHELTGIEVSKRGYKLAGETRGSIRHVIDSIIIGYEKVKSLLRESEILMYEKYVETKILGLNLLKRISRLTIKSYRRLISIFIFLVIPAILLNLVLVYML